MKLQTVIIVTLSFATSVIYAHQPPSIERQKSASFIGNWHPRYSNAWNPSLLTSSQVGSTNVGGLLQGMVGGTQTTQRLVQPLMQGMIGTTQFAAPRTSLFSGLLGSLGSGLLGTRGMIGTNVLSTGLGTGTINTGIYGTNIGTFLINNGTNKAVQLLPISTGSTLTGQNLRNLLATFLRPPSAVIVNQYPPCSFDHS